MAKFVILGNWTEQGIRSAKETTRRAAAAREGGARMGVRMIDIWWTLGQYDFVAWVEADDIQKAVAFLLALGMQGNVRTTTLQAFDAAETDRIMAMVP
ncbi:MAG: GYD family protein [Chloroflexi bacterium GWC2_73_18]|nr:MAG: GYD family protein [Chloroflexi bacterium GWC2_73_18]